MYYKTNHPPAIEGWNQFHDKRIALHNDGKRFAIAMGADAGVVVQNIDTYDFAGIKFNRRMTDAESACFSRPSRANGSVNLLNKPRDKQYQEEFTRYKNICAEFADLLRNKSIDMQIFKEPLGYGWGDLIFHRFQAFEHDGFIYICTCCPKVADFLVEILGSEYRDAQVKSQAKGQ